MYTRLVNDGQNVVAHYVDGKSSHFYRGSSLIGYTNSSGDVNFYQFNAHGDVVSILDCFGNTVRSYNYDAFGKQKDNQDSFYRQQYGTEIDDNPFRYCGEYFDDETGLIYLRARYYDPETQRFVREDPIRDGLNWYVYCRNNPNFYIDPTGLSSREKLRSISDQFNSGSLTDEQVTEELLKANGGNVYLAFHEIAQVHIARQLKNSWGAENVILEYPISFKADMRGGTVTKHIEADIVADGAVWEVKPLGTSGENQLKQYTEYGDLSRGQPLFTIIDIPIFDDIKMKIEFPSAGNAKYSFYSVEYEPEGSKVTTFKPVAVKRKIDSRERSIAWKDFGRRVTVVVNQTTEAVKPYIGPVVAFAVTATVFATTGMLIPA